MENNLLSTKRTRFGIYEAALASLLFIVFNFVFVQIYGFIPKNVRSLDIVYYVASFFLEFVFALTSIVVALSRRIDIKKASGIDKKISLKTVGYCFLISIVSLFGFGNLTTVFVNLLSVIGYSSILPDIVINSFWQYLAYIICSCVAPALFEEFLFRGTILSGLKQCGIKIAVIVSALIFTFMHGNPEQTVHQFVIGALVGYIFFKTGNLWIGILIHFFNNFISVTQAYILSGVYANSESTEVVASQTVTVLDFVITLIIALILAYFGYCIVKYLIKKVMNEDQKLNGENETVLDSISVDGKDVVVEVAVDGGVVSADSDLIERSENKLAEEKKPLSVGVIVMFTLSAAYMAFEWLSSLLIGLGVV